MKVSVMVRQSIAWLAVAVTMGCVVAADAATEVASAELPPTHYVYRGHIAELPLDLERIAVSYRVDATSSERAAIAANLGISLASSKPTGVSRNANRCG